MIAARKATLVTILVLVTLYFNHIWLGRKVTKLELEAQQSAGTAEPGALPDNLRPFVKVNNFAVRYPYVLIPAVWAVAFAIAQIWTMARARPVVAGPAPTPGVRGDAPGRPSEPRDPDPRA